jgi:hypothetical protein
LLTIEVPTIEAPVIAPVRRRPAAAGSASRSEALPAGVPEPAASGGEGVSLVRDGWRVAVRIPSTDPLELSEPFHIDGRTRLYVTVPGVLPALSPSVNAGSTGRLMNLTMEQQADGARLEITQQVSERQPLLPSSA